MWSEGAGGGAKKEDEERRRRRKNEEDGESPDLARTFHVRLPWAQMIP